MFGRIMRRSDQKSTENRVDSADHLKIILSMATVPLPSRRPNEVPEQDLVVQVPQARRGTRKGPDQLGSGNDAIWPLSQTSINPMRRGLFRLVIQLFDMLVEHSSGLYWK
jgi:hypothetical protein